MVALVNSDTNATSKRWHLWELELGFAPELPPGWVVNEECTLLAVEREARRDAPLQE